MKKWISSWRMLNHLFKVHILISGIFFLFDQNTSFDWNCTYNPSGFNTYTIIQRSLFHCNKICVFKFAQLTVFFPKSKVAKTIILNFLWNINSFSYQDITFPFFWQYKINLKRKKSSCKWKRFLDAVNKNIICDFVVLRFVARARACGRGRGCVCMEYKWMNHKALPCELSFLFFSISCFNSVRKRERSITLSFRRWYFVNHQMNVVYRGREI